MKKVLLLTHEYFPFRGGVARYCYNLFRYFYKQDYLVVSDHEQVKTQDNIIHLKLKSSWLRPTWLTSFFSVKKIIKQHNIGLIVTPNILPLGSMAYFFHKLYKLPYVISLHGLDIRLALKHKAGLTRRILSQASLIMANSCNTAQVIKFLDLGADKIKVFYPSLDVKLDYDEQHLKNLKNKYALREGDKILLTVGRLTKRKGQDLVIKAMAQLSGYNFKYFIIGSGDLKTELARLIEYYHMEDRVFILDNVSDEQLVYYYKMADVFVLPNRHDDSDVEGFGMVFMEAAAYRLSIIAGNSGGVAEIWENNVNAILIDNENIVQLIEALQKIFDNPELKQTLGQRAYEKYKEFPTAPEQSRKFKELLNKIT